MIRIRTFRSLVAASLLLANVTALADGKASAPVVADEAVIYAGDDNYGTGGFNDFGRAPSLVLGREAMSSSLAILVLKKDGKPVMRCLVKNQRFASAGISASLGWEVKNARITLADIDGSRVRDLAKTYFGGKVGFGALGRGVNAKLMMNRDGVLLADFAQLQPDVAFDLSLGYFAFDLDPDAEKERIASNTAARDVLMGAYMDMYMGVDESWVNEQGEALSGEVRACDLDAKILYSEEPVRRAIAQVEERSAGVRTEREEKKLSDAGPAPSAMDAGVPAGLASGSGSAQ